MINLSEIEKLKVLVVYQFDDDPDLILKVNEKTEVEQIVKYSEIKNLELNAETKLKLISFDIPPRNFLKEKNQVIFELSDRHMLVINATFTTPKYSFTLKDQFSFYFMIGLKFQKNEKNNIYKDPPGKAVDDEILEFYYFFKYIIDNHKEEITKEFANREEIIKNSMKKLTDLIEIFKMINRGGIGNNPRVTVKFLKLIDEFILNISADEQILKDFPEILLFVTCLIGVFNYDYFVMRDYSLNESFLFLRMFLNSKFTQEDLIRFEEYERLKDNLTNGLYILVNFSIKESSGLFLNMIEFNIFHYIFDEKEFFIRLNDFIRRSGTSLKSREHFFKAKQFLIDNYLIREKEMRDPEQAMNSLLKNIAILSINKENLLETLFELYEREMLNIDKLRTLKDEIKRKKWQSLDENNFANFIKIIRNIIDNLDKKIEEEEKQKSFSIDLTDANLAANNINRHANYTGSLYSPYNNAANRFISTYEILKTEFSSLLYDLSSSINYIFTLMKIFNYQNLEMTKIKRAIGSVMDFSLDDYAFILGELNNIPEEIKKEIIGSKDSYNDSFFFDRIKCSLRKINSPFNNKTKEVLIKLLTSKNLFENGSYEFIKELIRNKPTMEDLIFIVSDLIIPQRESTEEESYIEMFIYIKNYFSSNIKDAVELISHFSLIMSLLNETQQSIKMTICADFWKTINQKFSPEVFLGLCQIFNEKQKFDEVIEISYIEYIRSFIQSINSDIQNYDKVNQFFNSLSIVDKSEKFVLSDNPSTENIIKSILDILEKVSDPQNQSHNFIIENPSKENFWYRLINSRGKCIGFMNHNYILSIVNQIILYYEEFIKCKLSVSDLITISKHSNSSKETIISYFYSVVKNNTSFEELMNHLDKNLKNLNENLNVITEVETFFNHYGSFIDMAEETTNLLQLIKMNFKSTQFRNFVLPEDILRMKTEIKFINQWSDTIIFSNVFSYNRHEFITKQNADKFLIIEKNQMNDEDIPMDDYIGDFERDLANPEDEININKKKLFSLKETFDLAEKSFNEIKSTLFSMINLNDLSKLSLGETMKYFKGLGKVNMKEDYLKETELIGNLMNSSNYLKDNLRKILKTFCEISIFIKFSSTMLKLDSVLKFSINNSNVYKEFMELINNPENSFDKIFQSSENVFKIMQKYVREFDIENLFFELAENKDLILFLINTPDEDIRNMVDAVDEHGDSFIRVQTIRDLLIIGSFVRGIRLNEFFNSREDNPTEEELIFRIVNFMKEHNSYGSVDALINSCGKQFLGIKHLHNELSNREEASKIKAKEICKNSYFDFDFNFYKKNYEVNVSYGKVMKRITFRDLCDLRDRVLLLLYNEKDKLIDENSMIVDNNDNIIRDVLSNFIKVVEVSEKIIFILNDIYHNGYPINVTKSVRFIEGVVNPFQTILDDISLINEKWNDDLKEAYTLFYPLTYFNGNQFWQLESLFTNDKIQLKMSYGYHLLNYADPHLDVINIVIQNKYNKESINSPRERLFKLGEVLVKIIDPIHNGAKIINLKKSQLNLRGSHFIFSNPSNMRIYHHLLSIHFIIENKFPAANQIFYCTKNTNFHDVISFLSRFVYCPVKRLFSIVRVENLSFELQNFLVERVNKLMKQIANKSINLNSLLCVISCDNNSFINTQFQENPYIYNMRDFDVLDENSIKDQLRILNLKATTIRSDDTGAGKTHYIKNIAKGYENTRYINFPLLDAINIDKISERFYELNQYSIRKFIHITIGGIIDDFEMLDYILFKFIILGCLKQDIFVSYRNDEDIIFIEVSNTFNDYLYNSISIIPLIPNEEMILSKVNLHSLDMGKYSFDPIQIVCNYLSQFDQNLLNLNDIDINKGGNCKMFKIDECLNLLNKYFIQNNPNCTFRQLQIFISILSDQLVKFSNNFYFTCENLKYIQDINLVDVRMKIMSSLLLMTEEFTVRSIKSARDSQNHSILNIKRNTTRENLSDDDINAIRIDEINSLRNITSWSKSNHLLIMFHDDGYCMTPVYRDKNDVPDAVKQLMETQKAIMGDYQKMSHTELMMKLCAIVGREYLEEFFIDSDYVMTADNFLKMLLIIIRSRSNVPIVIMGETGCGKTSLVRFLATRILSEGFEVINFHAGIKESFIIEKLNEIKQKAYDFFDGKIWVFLDEINTCDCMGLITEILTQNSVHGDPLPYNIVFIAACNPYRIRKDEGEIGLIKQRLATKLVYRVHPLPDSLIDLVWDYGSLTESEEKLYIANMLSNITGNLKSSAIDLVVRSQVFIRRCEDEYSVSLRDVARFKILHDWFYKIIKEKNEKDDNFNDNYKFNSYSAYFNPFSYYNSTNIKYTGKLMIARKALILSLMMCYYNRISRNEDRNEYKRIITRFLSISTRELEEMINEEQTDIVTRMELPPAIAINKALLENVFTLMVCVINKIPLFICGKPGCSKSLAVQLLVSNLRGQDSKDSFFKKLPRILAIPYQGSESSTSEGIEKIFEKAHNVLKNADKTILPLIVFDEIGLAEISKNNPLKILHSLLEPENPQIAFVGISNWRLDASKMNRAVYLARPDPDLEDLESTALSIFDYYIKEPRFDEKRIMKALAKTYFDFKKEQSFQGFSDFHGTRDFYSLIKSVTKQFNEHYINYNDLKYSIVKDALSRNFGGLSTSINSIHEIFARNMNLLTTEFKEIPQKSLMELVKENLRDKDSRFLLLFTNGESASYILDNYLKNDLKERVFLIGSEFEMDKDKDEHSFRLLSDIILYMESGSSVILKNLDQIYGSLYDLFNQNFMIVGQKKNCRIALGSTNNPMCFVQDNFHCVVLVDIKDMNRMDPPFLNRFEKQILKFDSVLNNRQREIVSNLENWIKAITSITQNENYNDNLNLNIEEMIITYNDEFCPSLAMLHYNENSTNEEILERCKMEVLSVSNLSLIVFSVLSQMYHINQEEVIKAHKIYFDEQSHDSISQYVNKTQSTNNKLIVYTHSNILDEIKFSNLNTNKMINYSVINIAEIKSEKDFDQRFKKFLFNKDDSWLLIKIDQIREKTHIPMIKFKSDKFLNEHMKNNNTNKNVMMIVYLPKNKLNENHKEIGSHFLSGWNQIMINCLNGGQIGNLKSLLDLSTIEVVKANLDANTISEMIFKIYLKFNFIPFNKIDNFLMKEFMTETLHKIENDNDLINIIRQKCLDLLTQENNLPDWKIKICCDNKISSKSINTFNAIKLFVAELIEEPMLKIFHFLESESALDSFFINEDNDEINNYNNSELNRKIWKEIFDRKDFNLIYPYNVIQSLVINPVFDLNFPFSKSDIIEVSMKIKESIEKISILDSSIQNHPNNEDNKINLTSEIENVKRIIDNNLLNKTLLLNNFSFTTIEERYLQNEYIGDLITFFLIVELKKPIQFFECLNLIIEKSIGLDYENLLSIFIFLYKNKKNLDSIFELFDILTDNKNKEMEISGIEKILSNERIYIDIHFNNSNRRSNEIKLFVNIYEEIAKILLSYFNDFNLFSSVKKNYASILNSFITHLLNFSMEIKSSFYIQNVFVIINEYLKILSILYDGNIEFIFVKVKDVFYQNKLVDDSVLNELKEFNFIIKILSIIDDTYDEKLREKNDMMLIDYENDINNQIYNLDDFKQNIINSKLIILENVPIHTNKMKSQILFNIIKDVHLIKYSYSIFDRIFSDCVIDETFEEVMNYSNMIDSAIEINQIDSYDHLLFSSLSDFFRKYLNRPINNKNDNLIYSYRLKDYLTNKFSIYRKYFNLISEKSKFLNILGFAGLKHYLEIFGEYLSITYTGKFEKDSDLISNINSELEILSNLQLKEVIKNYILKSLMKNLGCNAQALSYVNFQEIGIKWIDNKLLENLDNIIGIELNLSGLDKLMLEYSGLFYGLLHGNVNESVEEFKKLLIKSNIKNSDKNSFELRLMILQFFINKIYLSHSNEKFGKSLTYNHIIEIFEKCTDDIRENLGNQILIFLNNLIYNFNNSNNFFQIQINMDANKLGILAFILQNFNIILSSTEEIKKQLPYSQIFKKDEINLINNFNNLENLFIPGGFVDFCDESLLSLIKNIDENFSIYGSTIGLYECSCGYLYTIGDCTRPSFERNCPKCNLIIGGTNHIIHAREGHKCIINAENRTEGNKKQTVIDYLKNKMVNRSGYVMKISDELSLQYSLRNLSSILFRFFNLINHSTLLLMIELGFLKEEEFTKYLKDLKNTKDYLKSHFISDFSKLGELLKVKDYFIFPIIIINQMIFYNQNNTTYDLTKANDRLEYENFIENRIIRPKLEKIAEEIKEYKIKYSLDKKLTYSKILDENFTEEEIRTYYSKDYLRIFRMTRVGDWDDLKSEFMKSSKKNDKNYQCLKLLIEKFDEMNLLSNLYPIIQFSNYMLNLCNYRLTRQEAKEKKIREVIQADQIGEKMFEDFSEAWSRIAHKCTQYACKTLPILEKIDSNLPVSFVLMDDRELGYGMYMAAAMQYLGQIQNEVMEAIVYLIKENNNYQIWSNVDTNKNSIQNISPHEIVMYQTEVDFLTKQTEKFSKFYEIFNPNFGQGTIIEYNFEKIENELALQLLTNKKFLNYEELNKIQFKFELLSINNKNSNLLNEIKSKIEQRILIGEEKNMIKRTLEKLEQQNVAYLHQLFSSIEIVLCNLRYSNNVEECTISNYVNKTQNADKISVLLKETQPFCHIKISNLISFYELVEDILFKHVVEYVSPEYKINLDEMMKNNLKDFFEKTKICSSIILNAIQRFVIRCLVVNIEAKFPIKEYLMRRDFWDLEVKEEVIDIFYDEFPNDILIANTLNILDYIKEENDSDKMIIEDIIDLTGDKKKMDQLRLETEKRQNKFI